jgi:hypothetical protein
MKVVEVALMADAAEGEAALHVVDEAVDEVVALAQRVERRWSL